MNTRYALVLLLGMTCSMAGASDARAQFGYGLQGGFGYGAFDVGRLYQVMAENVPHFAAFPPVYYSAPVPRTYGYSPFAYPPGVMTPEVVAPQPLELTNPHVPAPATTPPAESDDKTDKTDKTTKLGQGSQPLVLINPYATMRLVKALPGHLQAANLGR